MSETQKPKQHKLDLFRQVLPALHRGDKEFYNNLSEEERKGLSPFVLMRWLSLVKSNVDAPYYIFMVNELVNQNFWELSKHPELQWKLLTACVLGGSPKHQWIPLNRKPQTTKVEDVFLEMNPTLNRMELDMVLERTSADEFKDLLKGMGWPDDEIKPVLAAFKKYKNQDVSGKESD